MVSYWIDTLVLKNSGKYLCYFAASSSPLRGNPTQCSRGSKVPDTLSAALKSTSIIDEHRALMGAVIEKIQSTESGLNEAYISLITGFVVCFALCVDLLGNDAINLSSYLLSMGWFSLEEERVMQQNSVNISLSF